MTNKMKLYPAKTLLTKNGDEGMMDYLFTPYGLMLLRTLGQTLNRTDKILMPVQTEAINISLVTAGEANLIVNQHNLHLSRGCLLLKTIGSIIQLIDCSEDYDMQVLDVSDEFVNDVMQGHVPPMMQPHMKEWMLRLSEDEQHMWHHMTDALRLAIQRDYNQMVKAQAAAVIQFVHDLILNANKDISPGHLRNVELFNRFLQLVNKYGTRHRRLEFYARELCMNKTYMSNIISATSNKKASRWIEEANVARIKTLLRHTDLSIQQIAYEMNFPEASHLSRYFRRVTGMTPAQYRGWK